MRTFRKLADSIIFKFILCLVVITFIFFGVSDFIFNAPKSWVVKIGNNTVSYNSFNKAMQNAKDAILAVNKSDEALKYIDSEQFKSDILGKIVNQEMVKKLSDDFGIFASRKIILNAIAKEPNFKNEEGKFDRKKFQDFLAKAGFDEEKYVNEVSDEIVATMVINTIVSNTLVNPKILLETESFKQEKRIVDLINIYSKNLTSIPKASEEEVSEFFERNKEKYKTQETRQVSYFTFSKSDFASDIAVSDKEVQNYYNENKNKFKTADTRSFYHLLFSDQKEAQDFLAKINSSENKDNLKTSFVKLAKDLKNKDQKAITLKNISEKDLIPELSSSIFKLELDQLSDVLSSPLGFHLFLLTEIKAGNQISFDQVKNEIKTELAKNREEKILQEKISAIDDALMTSDSLEEVVKKFNFKIQPSITINQSGQNEKNQTKTDLDDFAINSFKLKEGQISKLFSVKSGNIYYALKIEKINPPVQKTLSEIKQQVLSDLNKQIEYQTLNAFANKVADEIKSNPLQVAKIVAKYKLKLETNREFPRILYLDFQGRQIPYQNPFLESIFSVKVGEVTKPSPSSTDQFVIAIVKSAKKIAIDQQAFDNVKKSEAETFRNEMLQQFNSSILKRHPVKVNDKIFNKKGDEL